MKEDGQIQSDYAGFFSREAICYQRFEAIVDHATNFGRELRNRLNLKSHGSLLSIGAGMGELELSLAKERQLTLGYIDPSEVFAQHYRAQAAKQSLLASCREIYLGRFQEYQPQGSYDAVIAIHSWYGIGKDETMLQKALQLLSERGQLFIVLVSNQSPVWQIAAQLLPPAEKHLCAEDLVDWISSKGCQPVCFMNHKQVSSRQLLNNEELTPSGMDFVSFLTKTAWNDLSRAQQELAYQILRRHEEQGTIDLRCGCILLSKP